MGVNKSPSPPAGYVVHVRPSQSILVCFTSSDTEDEKTIEDSSKTISQFPEAMQILRTGSGPPPGPSSDTSSNTSTDASTGTSTDTGDTYDTSSDTFSDTEEELVQDLSWPCNLPLGILNILRTGEGLPSGSPTGTEDEGA
ncbi:hypothetical protein NX059_000903 [Plenodomus lindquistii]|nr:hypothetical protein NX059_000903 [Plenodomus lindquistii]